MKVELVEIKKGDGFTSFDFAKPINCRAWHTLRIDTNKMIARRTFSPRRWLIWHLPYRLSWRWR